MILDLALVAPSDRKLIDPAEQCDECGAPDGSEIWRGSIRGAPAWARPGVWAWRRCDGRFLGIHIPNMKISGEIRLTSKGMQHERTSLHRGRCKPCRRRLKIAPLLKMMEAAI
jgi:hypothetical protein